MQVGFDYLPKLGKFSTKNKFKVESGRFKVIFVDGKFRVLDGRFIFSFYLLP